MHRDLVLRYIKYQALILAPIAPHWSDYIWQEVLGKVSTPHPPPLPSILKSLTPIPQPSTIQTELWPTVPAAHPAYTAARDYVRTTSSNITSAEAAQQKKKDKGKTIAFDPKRPKKLTIFAAAKHPAWQEKYIDLVRAAFDGVALNDKDLIPRVTKMGEGKKAMPFVQALRRRLVNGESADSVFERKLLFDELATLREMAAGLRRTTGCTTVDVVAVEEGGKTGTVVLGEGEGKTREGLPPVAEAAVPGNPSFHFENVEA